MLTLPISFFQASNSGHTWFLCRRHRAMKPRFEKVLLAFLHIVVQNFGNIKCSPLPTSFFQASESGQKWFLCWRFTALKLRFEKVLAAFLHIVVQNFGNSKCWPFQYHSSKLLIPATRGFCAEGIEQWNLALRRFCQHFFTSLSEICWPLHFNSSNLLNPAKSGFCAESIEHWILAFRRFWMVTVTIQWCQFCCSYSN